MGDIATQYASMEWRPHPLGHAVRLIHHDAVLRAQWNCEVDVEGTSRAPWTDFQTHHQQKYLSWCSSSQAESFTMHPSAL